MDGATALMLFVAMLASAGWMFTRSERSDRATPRRSRGAKRDAIVTRHGYGFIGGVLLTWPEPRLGQEKQLVSLMSLPAVFEPQENLKT